MSNKIPNLFIVGVAKAGTTVLANYLSQHPDIFMSKVKEPDFFSNREINEAKLYYKTKPLNNEGKYLSLFKQVSHEKWIGEASVSYFFYKACAERIKLYSPESKIILIVRHPIDRAYSHYLMDKRLGFVKADFEDIVKKPASHEKHYDQYIQQGFYSQKIEEYQNQFGENLLILPWQGNLELSLKKIFHFLNIAPIEVTEVEANKSMLPKNDFLQRIYSNGMIRKGIGKVLPVQLIQNIKSKAFVKQDVKLSDEMHENLEKIYHADIKKTQELVGFTLKSNFK
ncbi:MAG: sulfotransferase [Bacteroidetes bacterium]|nr:MAG: sulfotransferase [Bacteroidota bacterium]MBL1144030.1 sulfotransferase [Bacteroidota bacterium]NOG56830.1 hypothetical protein [Bacteroidota bacterium]